MDGEIVRAMLAAGADVNRRRSPWHWTPLHNAVARSHVQIAELLLEAGADLNARDRLDRTLSIARRFEERNRRECEEIKCQEMIDLLLAHGGQQ